MECFQFSTDNFPKSMFLCIYMCLCIYTGYFFKLISFHKLISMQIPVHISSHFDSMFLSQSKFDVSIFTDIEMPFTGREKAFCVLKYAQSYLNKTV